MRLWRRRVQGSHHLPSSVAASGYTQGKAVRGPVRALREKQEGGGAYPCAGECGCVRTFVFSLRTTPTICRRGRWYSASSSRLSEATWTAGPVSPWPADGGRPVRAAGVQDTHKHRHHLRRRLSGVVLALASRRWPCGTGASCDRGYATSTCRPANVLGADAYFSQYGP